MKRDAARKTKRRVPLATDPNRRLKAIALRDRGFTFQQIADALGITRQRAHQLVHSPDVAVEAALRAERNRRMLALWQRGINISTLAHTFGLSGAAVSYALRRAQEEL